MFTTKTSPSRTTDHAHTRDIQSSNGRIIRNCGALPRRRQHPSQRRGVAAVFGLILTVSLIVLMGFVADLGYINVSRTELSRSADAAALAGCWELYESKKMSGGVGDEYSVVTAADQYSSANQVASMSTELRDVAGGIQIGRYNPTTGSFDVSASLADSDAVRVNLAMNQSGNGEIPLFFGALTGRDSQALSVSSIAAFQKNISGFRQPTESGTTVDILPIALDLETWQQVVDGATTDNVAYVNGKIQSGSDGFFECSLYPTGTGSPGNRGTVDIGGANNSTSDLRRQILNGISPQDFIDLGYPLEFDSNGELELNGDTGISAGIKAELEAIIGQTRIIPIFQNVSGNGNNAMYTIVAWEGIRILRVKLTGPMKKKHLTIQPAPVLAKYCTFFDDGDQQSAFLYSPVMLVQ
ncbi:pilus assembly protein TadG-related protein [Crateriforma conspicua]|uniref:Flp pilus-assembly TadG-like N-terminal domain-containing protein n=1 Tax=Crateriforma conspicua TaxID=2527996 RepID=A0A5C6FZ44_9PLAN|nr:pilus assembly protein TadG-related protein [Crateriforma conspicua]TWU67614.1 hypothetical protein V7x_31890 [Crateriforma conspicua]